jgi:beta-phosphoglucomutase
MADIKACIFDLDGVIVDTALYHYEAWMKLAHQLGFDFSLEQNEELKGISRIDSLKIILNWGNIEKSDEEIKSLAEIKNSWYVNMISEMTPAEILPGAAQFLKDVSKNAATILKQVGLYDDFDILVDGNNVTKSKPDPEVFLMGAQQLGVPPENCVVFEDAVAGVAAAKNGKMKVVGIGNPILLKDADLVVAGLHEMTLEKLIELS